MFCCTARSPACRLRFRDPYILTKGRQDVYATRGRGGSPALPLRCVEFCGTEDPLIRPPPSATLSPKGARGSITINPSATIIWTGLDAVRPYTARVN